MSGLAFRFSLGGLLLAICASAGSAAQSLPAWMNDFAVSPGSPAYDDESISVSVGGIWHDGCVPTDISVNVLEADISVEVGYPVENIGCLQVLTPWSLETTIEPLDVGVYEWNASLFGYDALEPTSRTLEIGPDPMISEYEVLSSEQRGGDLDGDGDVDVNDRSIQISNWTGAGNVPDPPRTILQGDMDNDGDVDSADVTGLVIDWTGAQFELSQPTVNLVGSVPEPTSFSLAMLCFAPLWMLVRRRPTSRRS